MPLGPITVDEFAALETANGGRTILRDGVHWKAVRPFFYQPLIPWMEYPAGSVRGPIQGALGGWQHVVCPGEPANSSLKFLAFSNLKGYKPEALDYNRRRQLKIAMKRFEVREMEDREELARAGYPVYLSFFSRTGYDYFSSRTRQDVFEAWAHRLFDCGRLLIQGAYDAGQLCGLSFSYLFGSTLAYVTFFANDEAQKHFVSDLMLHKVREAGGLHSGVSTVLATRYKGGTSLDKFYLMRGAEIVVKPSLLRINPAANLMLRSFFPSRYQAVWGGTDLSSMSLTAVGKAEF